MAKKEQLIRYRVWCVNEQRYVTTDFMTTVPDSCPNSNNHTIDTEKTSVLDIIESNGPATLDGKQRVQETPRPLGSKTHFTSFGDDETNPFSIGNGQAFEVVHNQGDSTEQVIYLDFNCIVDVNDTWIFKGNITYENTKRDRVRFDMISHPTNYETSVDPTPYRLYNGTVLPNALGVGEYIDIPSIVDDSMSAYGGLIYAPVTDLGETPTAYWNADWDMDSTSYVNITPAPYGDGQYNMFTYERVFVNFVDILLLGSYQRDFTSKDVDQLGHGISLKVTAITRGDDHDWQLVGDLLLFRSKTI